MKDFTIVIPSYWGRKQDCDKARDQAVFDHPTDLLNQGTLPRLLKSLDIFKQLDGRIIIIAVANQREIAAEVEEKINSIIEPYRRDLDLVGFGQSNLQKVSNRLAGQGVSKEALEMVNLDNYAAVRNICSLAGILSGSRYTVFIDDDEVFEDSSFFDKIAKIMGSAINGETVEALAGYYLQPDTYRLDDTKVPSWRRPCWNNAAAMNRAFDLVIGSGERIKKTPFVFGGNMTLSLSVLKRVPFDPRITRGEDIDFLLNLRINDITFYLHRELAIKHLPPDYSQKAWKKLREDAVRFLYERKKLNDHSQLSLEEFQPYPGLFLDDDLEERIIITARLLSEEYRSEGDSEGVEQCNKIIDMARNNPFADFDTRTWLQQITTRWQEIASKAESLGIPE